jgi:hypothetical protein
MQKLQHSVQFTQYFVRFLKDKRELFMSSNGANCDNIVGNLDKVWKVASVNKLNGVSYRRNTRIE